MLNSTALRMCAYASRHLGGDAGIGRRASLKRSFSSDVNMGRALCLVHVGLRLCVRVCSFMSVPPSGCFTPTTTDNTGQ